MLKLLIPILDQKGALEAARHSAFLFAEHCVSEVEIVEVLDDLGHDRSAAFHSPGALRRIEKKAMKNALLQTRAILDDAGVPYTWTRVCGPAERIIASYAQKGQADIVVLDASGLGFFRKWAVLARLRRLLPTPVTLIQ
ncbi:nucleotide-binding universal stress UspA family protein [Paraburkholderia bannensis]|uniref:Nucleotide-binding universal stress UspA family protein n=1 Tax=Paraburkholderia bannensis TaxID=765414 RepID=A0A7W9U1A5_9BURK|nr:MULTISPECIES: universal stress protein [Paraburkholderia]MBB3259435.1 nucleotide-binding universal stress UspA family protein [Paraburkholderia sp. WP4_3_2]MBB6104451.1 nucleotide-binding universal stress UspA family protein [Paraburkholderia bannensis]